MGGAHCTLVSPLAPASRGSALPTLDPRHRIRNTDRRSAAGDLANKGNKKSHPAPSAQHPPGFLFRSFASRNSSSLFGKSRTLTRGTTTPPGNLPSIPHRMTSTHQGSPRVSNGHSLNNKRKGPCFESSLREKWCVLDEA
jgi:hypothetical protein